MTKELQCMWCDENALPGGIECKECKAIIDSMEKRQ